jgi:UDP-N-acetylmuramoyl-tripeptide--D-alanyl-D-alanine ligase
MFELGEFSDELHREVGTFLRGKELSLITVGEASRLISEHFPLAVHFDNTNDAAIYLKQTLVKNDVVLFKASRGMRLERIIEIL